MRVWSQGPLHKGGVAFPLLPGVHPLVYAAVAFPQQDTVQPAGEPRAVVLGVLLCDVRDVPPHRRGPHP